MRERLLTGFQRDDSSKNAVHLTSGSTSFIMDVIAENIVRIRLSDGIRPLPASTLPLAALQPKALRSADHSLHAHFATNQLKVTVAWDGAPRVTIHDVQDGQLLYEDLPARSYNATAFGYKHYSRIDRTDLHIGLGEVGAPINLTNRSFKIGMSDSASYDAFNTDPLYKHTPFLVAMPTPTSKKKLKKCVGIFSASTADSEWNVGSAIDEPWGAFKTFEVESGGLEEYLIFGDDIREVLRSYLSLAGQPLLPPKWALGYLASSMGLAESDNPPAQTLLEGFLDKCAAQQIPCSAMHLSSGYTVTETKHGKSRNVFTLNKHRFPDFEGFCRFYHSKGLRVVPNIKPFLVEYHPDYKKLTDAKATFIDPATGEGVVTRIWALGIGETLAGAWLDTTSQAGFDWWRKGVSKLIEMGVDGIWNDNDEYSLHEESYQCAYDLSSLPVRSDKVKDVGIVGRSLFTEMLGKSSFDALTKHSPGRRPFILTRSSSMGTKQFAVSTWSGDNKTSWRTLKGNIATTINASLSLYHCYGSDVGGFAGPLPTPELFLRWVQINAYHTRFSIHSYKPNPEDPSGQATVNSPWMYPQLTHLIRYAIKRRYELVPYLYNLLHEGQTKASPPITFLGFPPFHKDPLCFTPDNLDSGNFWLGAGQMLICGVFEEGQAVKDVYLPRSSKDDGIEHYFQLSAPYDCHLAGTTVQVRTSLESIPVFVRAGSVIPVAKPCATISPGISATTNDGTDIEIRPGLVEKDDFRGVELFPPPTKSSPLFSYEWLEDDGESTIPTPISTVRIEYQVKEDAVHVNASWKQKCFAPYWEGLAVLLPRGDERKIVGNLTGATRQHHDGRLITEIFID